MRERWQDLKQRLQTTLVDYGLVAFVVWWVLFLTVLGGAFLAIRSGMDLGTSAEGVGAMGAAYVVAQLTKPVRIVITLAVTPVVAKVFPWLHVPLPIPGAEASDDGAPEGGP